MSRRFRRTLIEAKLLARQCAKLASEGVLGHSGLPHHANSQCTIPRAAVARHLEDDRCTPHSKEVRARFEKGPEADFTDTLCLKGGRGIRGGRCC